jgi:hypothetical protein
MHLQKIANIEYIALNKRTFGVLFIIYTVLFGGFNPGARAEEIALPSPIPTAFSIRVDHQTFLDPEYLDLTIAIVPAQATNAVALPLSYDPAVLELVTDTPDQNFPFTVVRVDEPGLYFLAIGTPIPPPTGTSTPIVSLRFRKLLAGAETTLSLPNPLALAADSHGTILDTVGETHVIRLPDAMMAR